MADLLLDTADALVTAVDGGYWGTAAVPTAAASAAFRVGSDVTANFPAGTKFLAAATLELVAISMTITKAVADTIYVYSADGGPNLDVM